MKHNIMMALSELLDHENLAGIDLCDYGVPRCTGGGGGGPGVILTIGNKGLQLSYT